MNMPSLLKAAVLGLILFAGCGGDGSLPSVATQPVDVSTLDGGTALFSVTATGNDPLSYQWQRSDDFGGTWADVTGATSAGYTTSPVVLANDDGAMFRCVVTNGFGSATSEAALLTVGAAPPEITGQPAGAGKLEGETATFVVTATGTAPLSYQWQRSDDEGDTWLSVTGATSASCTTDPVTLADDNGSIFRCVVTNTGGSATSAIAGLWISHLIDTDVGLTGVSFAALAWGDYDNDGDLDLVMAGSPTGWSGNVTTILYRNDAGAFVDSGIALPHVYNGAFAWGDYDKDGDLDLALAGGQPTGGFVAGIYTNEGGSFTDSGAALTGVRESSLSWGDYDNDGDLDLALAGRTNFLDPPVTLVYRNDNGTFADSGEVMTATYDGDLSWGDYNLDGVLDLAVTGRTSSGTKSTVIYINSGGALASSSVDLIDLQDSAVAWADFDADGDLDIALAGWASGGTAARIYRNSGVGFVDTGAGLTGMASLGLGMGDYDNDGDLDIALAGFSSSEGEVSKAYANCGGSFLDTHAGLVPTEDGIASWSDYDNDGDLDLLIAGTGQARIYQNVLGTVNSPPAAPTTLATSISGVGPYDVTFTWGDSSDVETPTPGLSYSIRVGTTPGGCDVISPMADVVSGTRLVPERGPVQPGVSTNEWTLEQLPAGTYYWSVQAVDGAFAGGSWAAEEQCVIP